MNAFTTLGVLVFWCWCFELGIWLGFTSDLLRIMYTSSRLERNLTACIHAIRVHLQAMRELA